MEVVWTMKDNNLYKNRRNRYLKRKRLKPVTVCIAAICNVGIQGANPAIVFCADRLVSAGIQFEGGESKIKALTNYCYAMQSSTDSLISDLILEKVKQKVSKSEKPIKIEEIVRTIRAECIAHKTEWIESAILFNYNIAFEKFKVAPESIVQKAVDEVRMCEYPYTFDIIVLGLEESGEAHVFVVNQDGTYRSYASLGFATIGSGGDLAFLELTKYFYARSVPAVVAIPRVYIAKKVSERAQGVGRYTDFAVLFLTSDPKTSFSPGVHVLSNVPDFLKKLDDAYNALLSSEAAALGKLAETVQSMLTPKPEPSQPQATQPQPVTGQA